MPLASIVANEASIPFVVSMEGKDDATPELDNAEDTHDTVSMEDVLDIDGSLYASDDGDEPATFAANVDIGVEQAYVEVHDEVEVNTERHSFKDEYTKSIRPNMAKVESLFARSMWSG